MHSLYHDAKVSVVSADERIDLSGYNSVVLCAIAIADPASGIAFTIRESDDIIFANATVVPPHQLLFSSAFLESGNSVLKIGYLGAKRYLYVTPTSAPDAMVAILSNPNSAPVA